MIGNEGQAPGLPSAEGVLPFGYSAARKGKTPAVRICGPV
jgi:hypothetical protein